jgi:hypothetical protein
LSADPRLLELGRAFEELRKAVSGPAERQVVLMAVFRANDELGRVARSEASLRGRLTHVQALLNAVTVEVKKDDRAKAGEAFSRAEAAFRQVRDGPGR